MEMYGETIETVWYCLKVYNRNVVRYIPQEYAKKSGEKWLDPNFICGSQKECFDRCNELNKEIIAKEEAEVEDAEGKE